VTASEPQRAADAETFARKVYASEVNGVTAVGHPTDHRRRDLHDGRPHARRQAAARGFVRQEQCALSDFLANRFGSLYLRGKEVTA
jgi:hypothetical protein